MAVPHQLDIAYWDTEPVFAQILRGLCTTLSCAYESPEQVAGVMAEIGQRRQEPDYRVTAATQSRRGAVSRIHKVGADGPASGGPLTLGS